MTLLAKWTLAFVAALLLLLLLGLTSFYRLKQGLSVLSETARRTPTEEQQRNAQERFRLLFDSNPIPTWVFDMETLVIVAVNATALKTYGYTHEEFLRFKITDIRPREDVPALLDSIQKENASAEDSGPRRHRKKSGEVIDVQIRSYPLNFDGKPARLVVATDITEQKARGRRLEAERRTPSHDHSQHKRLLRDYSRSYGPRHQLERRRRAYQKLSSGQIIGKHVSIFYTPDDVSIGKPTIELDTVIKSGRFEDDG
jgi:PAS domain S-box-containing protein